MRIETDSWATITSIVSAIGLAMGSLTACGGSAANRVADATPSAIAYHGVSVYLPLDDNTVMSFETETEGSAERGLLVMQVHRPRAKVVELNVGGKIRRLDLTDVGVRIVESGWLLKQPLEVGATFVGQNGAVRVSSIHRSVDVPAGHFNDCVETIEVGPTVRTLTVFCPHVGIALLEVESMAVNEPERVVARLKSYGKRVDLGGDRVRVLSE
ncbi:MAG TPA: hypothetical protein VIV60_29595 [Polyangiaceae bacterium]